MSSWHQCPVCGDVLPGDDPEATCRCITVPVKHYELTDDERAVALLALTTMRDAGGFGVERDRVVNAIAALSRDPLVAERVVGVRNG